LFFEARLVRTATFTAGGGPALITINGAAKKFRPAATRSAFFSFPLRQLSQINAGRPKTPHICKNERNRAATQAMTAQSAPARASPIVAVVDDDPAVCNSLKFSLELEGFRVRIYGSGGSLLRAGDLGECHCFVVDQKMPGLSGLETIAALRSRSFTRPAILIISQPSAALSARAAAAKIPIVEKPFLGNALVDCIRQACDGG
jgi:two-component system, LuxR family, response regulator FixJ